MYSLEPQKELLDALWRMAYLAEYREEGILSHLERIKGYTLILARGLDLPEAEAIQFSMASQLHDVGKAGLPESLVFSPKQYTDADHQKIRRHTILGAQMLSNSSSPLMQLGASIALHHHERWDGSGYPHGLLGEDIPLGARLCAIADVFDALTLPRPYRKEISSEDATRLVIGASGSLFDPLLVGVFAQMIDNILQVSKAHLAHNLQ